MKRLGTQRSGGGGSASSGQPSSASGSGGFQPKLPPANYPPQMQVEKLKGELFSGIDAATVVTVEQQSTSAKQSSSSGGGGGGGAPIVFPEIYEGQLDGSKKRHGAGVLRWPNGNTYIGQWRGGAMHGTGTFFYSIEMDSYTGEFAADKKHGAGRYVFANGNSYDGEFREDRRSGAGKYSWQCGDEYVGSWQDGKMHGTGVTVYANGNRYEGNFCEDRREGKGTLICSDGLIYEGEWKRNNRHGHGKISFPSGDFYEGGWADDRKHGKGIDVMKNGSRFEGEYVANVRCGAGSMTFANGDRYVGGFRDDKMHGDGKYDFSNGFVYEGDWHCDMRHGKGSYTFPSGHVYVGLWSNDRRSGAGRLTVFNGGKGGLERNSSISSSSKNSSGANEEELCEIYVGCWLEGKMHGHFDVFLAPRDSAAASTPKWEFRFFSGAWTNGAPSGEGSFFVPVSSGGEQQSSQRPDPSVLVVKGAWGKSSDSPGDGTIYRPSTQVMRVLRGASLVAQQQQQQHMNKGVVSNAASTAASSSSPSTQWWQQAGGSDDPWSDRRLMAQCAAASIAPERTTHSAPIDMRRALLHPILVRSMMCTQVSGLDDKALEQVFGPAECARRLRALAVHTHEQQQQQHQEKKQSAGSSSAEPSPPPLAVSVDEIEKSLAAGGCYDVSVLRGILSNFASANTGNLSSHVEVLDGLLALAQSSQEQATSALSALSAMAEEGKEPEEEQKETQEEAGDEKLSSSSSTTTTSACWQRLKRYALSVHGVTRRIERAGVEAAAATGEGASLERETAEIRASMAQLETDRSGMKARLEELAAAEKKAAAEREKRQQARHRELVQLQGVLDELESERRTVHDGLQQLRAQLDQAKELEGSRIDQAQTLRTEVQETRGEISTLSSDVQNLAPSSSSSSSSSSTLDISTTNQNSSNNVSITTRAGSPVAKSLDVYSEIGVVERNMEELREKLSLADRTTRSSKQSSGSSSSFSADGTAAADLDQIFAPSRSRAHAFAAACRTTAAATSDQRRAEEERRASQKELDDLRSKAKAGDVDRLRQAIQTAHERLQKLQEQEKEAIKAKEARGQLAALQKQLDKAVLAQEQELVLAQNQLSTKRQAVDALTKARDELKSAGGGGSDSNLGRSSSFTAASKSGNLMMNNSSPSTPRLECATEIVHLATPNRDFDAEIGAVKDKLGKKKQKVAKLREIVANRVAGIRSGPGADSAADPTSLEATAKKESLVHQCIKQRAALVLAMKKDLSAAGGGAGSKGGRRGGAAAAHASNSGRAASSDDEDEEDDEWGGEEHAGSSDAGNNNKTKPSLTAFATSLAAAVKTDRDAEFFEGQLAQLQSKLRIIESLEEEAAEIPLLEERLRAATKRL